MSSICTIINRLYRTNICPAEADLQVLMLDVTFPCSNRSPPSPDLCSTTYLNEEESTNYCVGVCPNCCVITLALLGCWSRSPNARCLWLSAAGGNSFIARLLTSMGTCSVPVGSQYRTRYFILCTLRIKFNIFKMISKQEDT